MSKTILVVDDRAINRDFLVTLLGYAGYRVLEAADGAEALGIIHQAQVALVISDILMPQMDGIELANRLHADPRMAHIPIIFYTATYRASEARMLAERCGVAAVLAKPSEPQTIIDTVGAALGIVANVPKRETSNFNHAKGNPVLPALEALQQRLETASLERIGSGFADEPEIAVPSHRMYATGNIHALSLRTAALLELGMNLSSELDAQQLLNIFRGAAQDIMSAKYTAIGMGGNDRSRRYSQRGMTDADVDAIFEVLDPRTGSLYGALFDGSVLRTRNIQEHPAFDNLSRNHPLRKSALLIPVVLRSHPYGWIYIADKLGSDSFNEEDEQFAAILAAQLAPTYENLVLFDEIQGHVGELELEIVERRRITEELRESEGRFRQLAENIHETFFLANRDFTQLFYVSPTYEEIWGRSCQSVYDAPLSWRDSIHPDDMAQAMQDYAKRDAVGRFDYKYRIVRPDGQIRSIRSRGFPIRDEDGEIARIAGIAEDITDQQEQARKITRLGRLYAVLSGINSAIIRIRDRNKLFQEACRVAVNQGAFNMAWVSVVDPGTEKDELVAWFAANDGETEDMWLDTGIGDPTHFEPIRIAVREMRPYICNDVCSDAILAPFSNALAARNHRSMGVWPIATGSNGVAAITLFASETDFFDADQIKLLEEMAGDLSFGLQFIEREERLNYLAYYDVLTNLPNSTLFHDRLTQFIHGSGHEDVVSAVILVDLQYFAQVNDAMGRHAGDMVLKEVAERLGNGLQEPFSLARLNGDTFAVAVTGLGHGTDLWPILEQQIFQCFDQPFSVDRQAVKIAARAGLAIYPEDGATAEALVRNAMIALNKAKASDERYLYYSPQMNAAILSRLNLESELRVALETHRFVMHYQPRVDLVDGRIVGAEALIRWQHPERGQISPAEFIPLAEETGLIVPIGAWVIKSVCAQQAAWLKQHVPIVPVAVNLSAVQFKRGQVLQTIADAIRDSRLDTRHIEFELTESVVMSDPAAAASNLQALKKMGIKLSLDDFGTGYSSLAYLKRFPFDIVKIDRAFVMDITRNPEDAAIASAIIGMAHSMGMKVVAEGVETQAQLQFLRARHCDEIQGYYFSRPLPAEDFGSMLGAGKHLDIAADAGSVQQTLLIVDDDQGNLTALQRALHGLGYRILQASDGHQGLEMLACNAVQVILCKQHMATMSGVAFLTIAARLHPDTMRIILSGYTELESVLQAVNRGDIYRFLTAPWDDEQLKNCIQDAFRRHLKTA
ncbi:MAG: EAL domain-containing protein [Burkholderiaceae bacterium]|nr:EAL domain-containing protein [Burkholderiaceae bacterium]